MEGIGYAYAGPCQHPGRRGTRHYRVPKGKQLAGTDRMVARMCIFDAFLKEEGHRILI